jgi:hypothetical protein
VVPETVHPQIGCRSRDANEQNDVIKCRVPPFKWSGITTQVSRALPRGKLDDDQTKHLGRRDAVAARPAAVHINQDNRRWLPLIDAGKEGQQMVFLEGFVVSASA